MTGVRAAALVVSAAGAFGVVGVAGASNQADQTIHAPLDALWEPQAEVTVDTGDTVTWTFDPNGFHNVRSTSDNWSMTNGTPDINKPTVSFRFVKAGEYTFICDAHTTQMQGKVTAVGPDVTPVETPPPTPTPTPTPSVQPSPPDRTAPAVSAVDVKARKRGARVRFSVSEPSTVTLQVLRRGSTRVLKTVRVQARGTRSVTLTSRKLKKGRYTVRILARDALGNTSALMNRGLRIKR